MLFTSEIIKKALSLDLPGETSHIKMLPKNRILRACDDDLKQVKHSSVLLIIFPENDDLYIILTKRPKHLKHHAGQIALPGGRIEKGETAIETALRETHEEIGINNNELEILGSLSNLYVHVSHFMIHPFVGWVNKKPVLHLNHNEVEKVILFPLRMMKNPISEIELSNTATGKLTVPCIKYDNEIIWGATAMILSEFYDALTTYSSTNQ